MAGPDFPIIEPDVAAEPIGSVAATLPPIAAGDPCGPDLELEGDADYLNFVAHTEGILPTSFFSLDDGKPFDRASIDLPERLSAIAPLLARSRDLRLMVLRARLSILNKDLAGFADSLNTVADWLDAFWDEVHPRPQDGDLLMRTTAIAELDVPLVTFPLQYAPLFDARRVGPVSYRAWMIASGDVKPRSGEAKLTPSAIMEARSDADPAVLEAAKAKVLRVKTSLDRIRMAFASRGASAGLDNLVALTGKIFAFVAPSAAADQAVAANDAGSDGSGTAAPGAVSAAPAEAPQSLAEAALALAAIADYYSQSEPSSPVLPLVRQAHQLIGKSFYEVLTILVPAQLDKAAFQIGGDQVFELPIGKLSGLTGAPTISVESGGPGAAPPPPPSRFKVATRPQAIALLDLVHRFFRQSEPSSPVPMLCDRARALAERDFMAVLRDVLPKAALKTIALDK